MKRQTQEPNAHLRIGTLLAKVLVGSWRPSPLPLDCSAQELDAVTPSLLESGAAALGWWRLHASELRESQSALELQSAYRIYTLQAIQRERDISRVLSLLRREGIEPIIVKGWAIARLYPETGLRPFGDIDLCVQSKHYARAKLLLGDDLAALNLDLHQEFKTLDERSWQELHSRSLLLSIDDANVRILASEDHLRVLCYHFLREGAWRPLWLCDIAVALETRPEGFDWDLFLSGSPRRTDWFSCTIVLAHRLLNVNMNGVPKAVAEKRLPRWLVRSVLKAWQERAMLQRHLTPMNRLWRTPLRTLKGLRFHWPNAIEGTIGMEGPFNEMPRLPFQLGNSVSRTIDFIRSMPRLLRDN